MPSQEHSFHPEPLVLFTGNDLEPIDIRPTQKSVLAHPEIYFGVPLDARLDNEFVAKVPPSKLLEEAGGIAERLAFSVEVIAGIRPGNESIENAQYERRAEYTDNERRGIESCLKAIRNRISPQCAGLSAACYLISGKIENTNTELGRARKLVYHHAILDELIRKLMSRSRASDKILSERVGGWRSAARVLCSITGRYNPQNCSVGKSKQIAIQELPKALAPEKYEDCLKISPVAALAVKAAVGLADTCDGSQTAIIVYGNDYLKADAMAIFNSLYGSKGAFLASKPGSFAQTVKDTYKRPAVFLVSESELQSHMARLSKLGLATDTPVVTMGADIEVFDHMPNKSDRICLHLSCRRSSK